MPRNVRNSWVEIDVDGRATTIGAGPRGKEGVMSARFYVRNEGRVESSIRVITCAYGGQLALEVRDPEGNVIYYKKTKR